MKQKLRLMAMLWSILTLLTSMCLEARAQRPESSGPVLSGIVTDTAGSAISGATIAVKGTSVKIVTNNQGEFIFRSPNSSGTLVITDLGYQTIHEKFNPGSTTRFHFELIADKNILEEVEVSTGYQTLPKERATGSFVQIDNELLERRVASTIIEKLDG